MNIKDYKIKYLSGKDLEWKDYTLNQIKNLPGILINNKKEAHKKIKKIKSEKRTVENTLLALEYADTELSEKANYLHLITNLHVEKAKRDAASHAESILSTKAINLERDPKMYQSLLDLKSLKPSLGEEEKLLLSDYIKAYERMGFSLSEKKQKEIKKLEKHISNLSIRFLKNINDYRGEIEVTKEQASGLSKNFLKTLKKNKKGNYIVSTDAAEYGTFISQAENIEKRKEISLLELTKGGDKNLKILKDILESKNKKAKILGYKNHAEYVISDRMAKRPEKVNKMIDSLIKKLGKKTSVEMDKLVKLKCRDLGGSNKKIEFYDSAFYSTKLKKEKYGLDPEEIREYFPLEHVLKNMFDLFGNLFGIELKKKKIKTWHKDVKIYAVTENDIEIGSISMDLFPREGKYGHMCVMDWKNSSLTSDKKTFNAPACNLLCNFRKASGKTPSLLSLSDVEGLFHEFGHALHNTLSRTKYASQSSFGVSWDFVELPSQLLEKWLMDAKVLKKISAHYKTGKSLPKKHIDSILESDKFMNATFYSRQLSLVKLDMTLHTKKVKHPEKLYLKLSKEITHLNFPKESRFPARFSHIVGGYDAGYYSYIWAQVFVEDVFSEFKKVGIFNKKIGKKYKEEILNKGSSKDETKMLKAFLGRNPNNKAFIKKIIF